MITKINRKAEVYNLYYKDEMNCDIYQSFRLQRRNAQDFLFFGKQIYAMANLLRSGHSARQLI